MNCARSFTRRATSRSAADCVARVKQAIQDGIAVALADGSRVEAICRGPKGSWGMPLAPSDHRVKLLDCFRRALPADKVDALIGLFERLESLDAGGVENLVALIASSNQRKETPRAKSAKPPSCRT